jgi:hypothetical protein
MFKIPLAPTLISHAQTARWNDRRPFRWLLLAIALITFSLWQSAPTVRILTQGLMNMNTNINTNMSADESSNIAVPEDWQVETLSPGVTAYSLPDAAGFFNAAGQLIDGTRFPYVSEVTITDFVQDNPESQTYSWNGIWQGEGYNRKPGEYHEVVAEREAGADIHLSITLDRSIADGTTPNLLITIQSDQNLTAQLTNISAFWTDPATGKTTKRKDFAQLPPVYDVTVTRNYGYVSDTKVLKQLGTIQFAYYVSSEEIEQGLPIRLYAVNQAFAARQQEMAELQAQGWVIKEVPAPNR